MEIDVVWGELVHVLKGYRDVLEGMRARDDNSETTSASRDTTADITSASHDKTTTSESHDKTTPPTTATLSSTCDAAMLTIAIIDFAFDFLPIHFTRDDGDVDVDVDVASSHDDIFTQLIQAQLELIVL